MDSHNVIERPNSENAKESNAARVKKPRRIQHIGTKVVRWVTTPNPPNPSEISLAMASNLAAMASKPI